MRALICFIPFQNVLFSRIRLTTDICCEADSRPSQNEKTDNDKTQTENRDENCSSSNSNSSDVNFFESEINPRPEHVTTAKSLSKGQARNRSDSHHPSNVMKKHEFLFLLNLITHETLKKMRMKPENTIRRPRKTANPKYTRQFPVFKVITAKLY